MKRIVIALVALFVAQTVALCRPCSGEPLGIDASDPNGDVVHVVDLPTDSPSRTLALVTSAGAPERFYGYDRASRRLTVSIGGRIVFDALGDRVSVGRSLSVADAARIRGDAAALGSLPSVGAAGFRRLSRALAVATGQRPSSAVPLVVFGTLSRRDPSR